MCIYICTDIHAHIYEVNYIIAPFNLKKYIYLHLAEEDTSPLMSLSISLSLFIITLF